MRMTWLVGQRGLIGLSALCTSQHDTPGWGRWADHGDSDTEKIFVRMPTICQNPHHGLMSESPTFPRVHTHFYYKV